MVKNIRKTVCILLHLMLSVNRIEKSVTSSQAMWFLFAMRAEKFYIEFRY